MLCEAGNLAAIKFLYHHFLAEEDLPDLNPAALEVAPRVATKLGYTPSSDDVRKLLECPWTPKGRLLAHWLFYAPPRRQTFSDALWRDVDLDQGTWRVMGKFEKFDIFDLAPPRTPIAAPGPPSPSTKRNCPSTSSPRS